MAPSRAPIRTNSSRDCGVTSRLVLSVPVGCPQDVRRLGPRPPPQWKACLLVLTPGHLLGWGTPRTRRLSVFGPRVRSLLIICTTGSPGGQRAPSPTTWRPTIPFTNHLSAGLRTVRTRSGLGADADLPMHSLYPLRHLRSPRPRLGGTACELSPHATSLRLHPKSGVSWCPATDSDVLDGNGRWK